MMNTHLPDPLELQIQRCVDGALTESEEVALLRRLENESAGWRQLALAFLEERLFRAGASTFQQCSTDPESVVSPVAAVSPAPPQRRKAWQTASTLSLSLLLGLGLGVTWLQWQTWSQRGNRDSLGSVIQITENPAASEPIGPGVSQPNTKQPSVPVYPVNMLAGTQHVAEVELPPVHPGDESLRVPVYDSRDVPLRYFEQMTPMVPPEVQAQLRRQGYDVDQQRQFMLIELQDGRRIVLPQDAVKVRYAVQ